MHGWWDKKRRLAKLTGGNVAIPVYGHMPHKPTNQKGLPHLKYQLTNQEGFVHLEYEVKTIELPASSKANRKGPHQQLHTKIKALWERTTPQADWTPQLQQDLPTAWQIHGDLALLNQQAFQSPQWNKLGTYH